MVDNRRFRRGSGAYNCFSCGKRTRDTGQGEASLELCLACMNESERVNYHSDQDHDRTLGSIVDPRDCSLCRKELGL